MALSTFFADPFFSEADRAIDRTLANMRTIDPYNSITNFVKATASSHAVDVIETNDSFKVVTDVPGFSPDDVKVELHEGRLTIRGESKCDREMTSQDKKYHVQERHFAKFTRQFQLPSNIVKDNIAANLDKGVLTVRVPKKPEPAKPEPKNISVTASTLKAGDKFRWKLAKQYLTGLTRVD